MLPHHHRIAVLEGARLDEHGGHGAAAAIQPAFHDGATGRTVRVRAQLEHFRLESGHLEELGNAVTALRGGRDEDGLTAPVFGYQTQVRQLSLHAIGLATRLVDLVHGHEDWHVGGFRVIHRLDGLRHHAVVRRHHEDHDVRGLGAAGAHGREGFVTRRVEEGDFSM